jgi:hypothetical protein
LKTIATAMLTIAAALALAACGAGGGESPGGTGASTATEAGAASKPPAQHQDGAAKGEGQGTSSGQSQGGDGSKGSGSGPAAGDTSASFTPPAHRDSATGAAAFETKGGDNSIQEFGAEGSGSDFEAAATALHGYLDARAAGAWRDACSYMSPGVVTSLAQFSGGSGGGASCPETLASLSAGVPAAALEEAAEAEVGALRIEGDRAFLLFHVAHGSDYFMPMAREGGAWKVGAIAASAVS